MTLRGPELYGKKRWTDDELEVAATFATRVYLKQLTYYGAMKLCHVALPARTEKACREVIRRLAAEMRKIDAADV